MAGSIKPPNYYQQERPGLLQHIQALAETMLTPLLAEAERLIQPIIKEAEAHLQPEMDRMEAEIRAESMKDPGHGSD